MSPPIQQKSSVSLPTSKPKVPTHFAQGKFLVQKRLGAGCFGEVFLCVNAITKAEVATKFEEGSGGPASPQLEHEAAILNVLRQPVQPQGFPEFYYFGKEGSHNVLVMELLGKSLEEQMKGCNGKKFTVQTTVLLAEQLLHRIEYLHSKGIIHRDIKPENWMCGVRDKIHHVYLIDYGLSKKYYDRAHAHMKQKMNLTGTARYASINAHKGFEQSRRDDLEAIGHMLMYFLRGVLPWSGLDGKSKQEKYKRIMEKKESTRLSDLCDGFPDVFQTYLAYCRNLMFKERPDYRMLRKNFGDLRRELEAKSKAPIEDHSFEWFSPTQDLGTLVPLRKLELQQPDDQVPVRHVQTRGSGFCLCGGRSRVMD